MKSMIGWWSTTYRNLVIKNKKKSLLGLYEKGKYESMARLFKTEKDYLEVTYDEFPFLYFIISEGNKDATSAFLNNVSFKDYLLFDEKNPLKCNPLLFAYLENKMEIADLLESKGFSLGIANTDGQSILHMAAIYRRKEAFFAGIRKKANIDLVDIFGNTPLHYSSRAGEVQMMEALLAGKAQKTANLLNEYPIHMAIESNKPEAVQLLKDDLWKSYPLLHPIHSAARVGALDIMRDYLKKQPTLINLKDSKGMTPLHQAVAIQNHASLAFLLKQSGVLVNLADEFGNTALHIAFMRDDLESATKLIEWKADLDIQNQDYLAPVDLALDSTNPQIRSYLKSLSGKSKRLKEWRTRI